MPARLARRQARQEEFPVVAEPGWVLVRALVQVLVTALEPEAQPAEELELLAVPDRLLLVDLVVVLDFDRPIKSPPHRKCNINI